LQETVHEHVWHLKADDYLVLVWHHTDLCGQYTVSTDEPWSHRF